MIAGVNHSGTIRAGKHVDRGQGTKGAEDGRLGAQRYFLPVCQITWSEQRVQQIIYAQLEFIRYVSNGRHVPANGRRREDSYIMFNMQQPRKATCNYLYPRSTGSNQYILL